jgi:DNA invertase Pin-like site-specific DNA recombinase
MTDTEHRDWWAENVGTPYGSCGCGCGQATRIATYTNRAKGYARGRPIPFFSSGHATHLKHRLNAEHLSEPNPSGLCMCGCGQPAPIARQTNTAAGWVKGKPIPYIQFHGPRSLSADREDEACRRYQAGETCQEIGSDLGVSRRTIARVLSDHGIERRPPTQPNLKLRKLTPEQEAEMCRRYEAGEAGEALAGEFGISGPVFYRVLKRNGVEMRHQNSSDPITPEQEAEIVRRYLAGEKSGPLSEEFGIENGTVYRVLKRNDVDPIHVHPYTEAQESEVCRRYEAGDEIGVIARDTGVGISGMYAILRRHGIERARTIWASEGEEAEICRRYVKGESTPILAREFGVTDGAILGVLERYGIPRRSGSEALRRYSCDHSFFDEIDTEAKAYWLGFIAADGCVTDKNVLGISLSSRDHDHLFRFRADIRADHPVSTYMTVTRPPGSRKERIASVSSISISSPQLAKALARHGIVPRKTFVLKWPENLPPELVRHFLRGYSDGDGCFHVSRSSYVRKRDGKRAAHLNWSIIGTEAFCSGARRYLGEAIGLQEVGLHPHSESPGIVTLPYGGNRQVSRIYHLLYDDATVFLPRKLEVARPYALSMAEAKPAGPSVLQISEMRRLYEAGQSSTTIGERFGFSGGTVIKALRRQGVVIRAGASTSPFTEEQEVAICERYLAGESSEKIAKEGTISAGAVLSILERRGVKRRPLSEAKRKYSCDHSFFDRIDTEEKAYWLGFIAADGSIGGNELVVRLVPEDRDHLLEFRKALSSTHPVRDYTNYSELHGRFRSHSQFSIRSLHLTTALHEWGVVAKKTATIQWPHGLDENLLRHYLRGYIDGNGGFYVSTPKGARYKRWSPIIYFSVRSNRRFLEGCQQYLIEKCNLSQVKIVKPGSGKGVHVLAYSGRTQVTRVARWLYADATVYLPRKYQKIAHLL